MQKLVKLTKQQWQWIFYDWANSGYGILVVTAVLPVYFKAVAQHAGFRTLIQLLIGDMPTASVH